MNRILPSILSVAVMASFAIAAVGQVEVTLTASQGTAQLDGATTVNAWLYNGQLPGPMIRVTEGETLRVRLLNQLPDMTSIHWHGLDVSVGMDGAPETGRPAVAALQEFTYEFTAKPAGTYFFHPHVDLQTDYGLSGVLIIDPADHADPSYDVEHIIVLDEWLNPFNEPGGYSGFLMNGKTSSGLEQSELVVSTGQTARLRFINSSVAYSYVVAVDQHDLTVTHTDGHRVVPVTTQAIPIGPGERYDVLVQANHPGAWSVAASLIGDRTVTVVRGVLRYAGSSDPDPPASYVPANLSSGQLLSYAQLAAAEDTTPIDATPDRTYDSVLGFDLLHGEMTINGEAWPNVTPMLVSDQESVQLNIVNTSAFYHPMHIHGHFFRLMGTAGGTSHPPLKDTVLMTPVGQGGAIAQVQFTAANPGRWLYHCHDFYHMMMGMMTLVDYTGDYDQEGLPDNADIEPLSKYPALLVPDTATSYQLGQTLAISVQWPQGETVDFYYGLPLDDGIPAGAYGDLGIWPLIYAGRRIADATNTATLSGLIPNNPSLSGLRIGLQAVATHATQLPPYRLSTSQPVTIH